VCRGRPQPGRGLPWPIFFSMIVILRTQQVLWLRNFVGADLDALMFPSLFHRTSRFLEPPQIVRQSQVNSYVGWLCVWQVLPISTQCLNQWQRTRCIYNVNSIPRMLGLRLQSDWKRLHVSHPAPSFSTYLPPFDGHLSKAWVSPLCISLLWRFETNN